MKIPEAPEQLPEDWNDTTYAFQVSVGALDDKGFTFRRRGSKLTIPRDPRDHDEFARGAGKMLEETLRIMLGMGPREEVG